MSKYAPHHASASRPRANASTICQKCLGTGHFIFECKSSRPYVSRPSRTQMLTKPELAKSRDKPSVEVPEEFKKKTGTANKILESREKEREQEKSKSSGKRKRSRSSLSSSSGSDSDSDTSSSKSSSDSDSDSGSDSSSRSRSRSRPMSPPSDRGSRRAQKRRRSRSFSTDGSR